MQKPSRVPSIEISLTLLLVLAACAGGLAAAEDGAEKTGSKTAPAGSKEAPETFSVVQVGDKVTVLKTSEVPAFRKKVSDDHAASLKDYNEARKKAAAAKKKFEAEKPVKPVVKTVASALKTEESARAVQKKALSRIEERKRKEKERKEKELDRARNGGK